MTGKKPADLKSRPSKNPSVSEVIPKTETKISDQSRLSSAVRSWQEAGRYDQFKNDSEVFAKSSGSVKAGTDGGQLMAGVRQSEGTDKPLFRGIGFADGAPKELEGLKPGSTFEMPRIQSFSEKGETADHFAEMHAIKIPASRDEDDGTRPEDRHPRMFVFETKGLTKSVECNSVRPQSSYVGEKEHIVAGRFKIESVKTKGLTTHITMSQVGVY